MSAQGINLFSHAALLATGSQDETILVHSLSTDEEEPLERYTGHQGLVTAITYQHGQLVSGAWDRLVALCQCMGYRSTCTLCMRVSHSQLALIEELYHHSTLRWGCLLLVTKFPLS